MPSARSNAALIIALLSAIPLSAQPTTIILATSSNPSVFGQPVTLTATVSPANATGAVTFYDGTTILAIRTLASGQAALTTTLLASGAQSIHAGYAGDSTHASSISAVLVQTVKTVPVMGFGPAVSYSTNGATIVVAVGDLNGDGKDDLLATNEFGNRLSAPTC